MQAEKATHHASGQSYVPVERGPAPRHANIAIRVQESSRSGSRGMIILFLFRALALFLSTTALTLLFILHMTTTMHCNVAGR